MQINFWVALSPIMTNKAVWLGNLPSGCPKHETEIKQYYDNLCHRYLDNIWESAYFKFQEELVKQWHFEVPIPKKWLRKGHVQNTMMQPIGQILIKTIKSYTFRYYDTTFCPFLTGSHNLILDIPCYPGCIHLKYCQIQNLLKKWSLKVYKSE